MHMDRAPDALRCSEINTEGKLAEWLGLAAAEQLQQRAAIVAG